MRVDVEHRLARQVDVAADERLRQAERRERFPDRLVHRERVRVDDERLEEYFDRLARRAVRRLIAGQRQPGAPVLRVLRDQPLA